MELTKEEMKKVIGWLDHYYDRTYGSHDSPMNLDDLPAINNKFKTSSFHQLWLKIKMPPGDYLAQS